MSQEELEAEMKQIEHDYELIAGVDKNDKNNYLKLSKSQILDQIKLMADQTDRLLLSQKE